MSGLGVTKSCARDAFEQLTGPWSLAGGFLTSATIRSSMSLARSIFVRGILSFGLLFTALMLGWDWLDGSMTSWPKAALKYAFDAVFGGALYGLLTWRFESRSRQV